MSWKDLLTAETVIRSLPWFGFRRVHLRDRTWTIKGRQPREHGWYLFDTDGSRWCTLVGESEPDPEYAISNTIKRGYLVGNRLIPDHNVNTDPVHLVIQTLQVYCVEPGLGRFERAVVVLDGGDHAVYAGREFPLGPEAEVEAAYQDRLPSINHIPGVTPPLDLAFRWISQQREKQEKAQREEEERRAAEERLRRAMRDAGTAVGRRELAVRDFAMAAREALRVSGAELLDVRDSYNKGEKVVQYRFKRQRLECVVDASTLRIIDAGVCLDDHRGTKGDTFFTLESLPGVINEAMEQNKLVVWRHI